MSQVEVNFYILLESFPSPGRTVAYFWNFDACIEVLSSECFLLQSSLLLLQSVVQVQVFTESENGKGFLFRDLIWLSAPWTQQFWADTEYALFKIDIVSSPWQGPQLAGGPREDLTGFSSPVASK